MKIVFGNYTFTDANHDIISAESYRDQALIADTLQADDFNFSVKVNSTAVGFDIEVFEGFAYGTPVSIYDDNNVLQSVFFVIDINVGAYLQTGEIIFNFECLSFVGTMIDLEHNGGVYTNSTNRAVIAEILNATYVSTAQDNSETYQCASGIYYVIDKNVADKRVDGWLPIGSVRDNLCKVLNASCVSILKNADGSIRFTFNQPDTPIILDPDYEYIGDNYSKTERYTNIAVLEHSFYALSTTDEELIYDSEGTVLSNSKIVFDKPYHTLRWTGTTITSSNCNYAILIGAGALYGKPYIHGQNQITTTTGLTGNEKYYTSDANTLITALNSASALERLKNYYGFAKELSCSFVVRNGIVTGSLVSVTDPLNRIKSGFVKRMNITHSGIDKADGIIVTDWVPVGIDEDFTDYQILTGTGTFTVPAGKRRILVVCIQGGQAGYNGSNGNSGTGGSSGGAGGAGGAGGYGGSGGSIYQELIQNPSSTYSYSAGSGGASNGALGTHSSFGDISSSSGSPSASGYMNLISGDIIATKGNNGIAGANGGNGGNYVQKASVSSNIPTLIKGTDGENISTYSGGVSGQNATTFYMFYEPNDTTGSNFKQLGVYAAGSGGGGGAALGGNGSGTSKGGAISAYWYNSYRQAPKLAATSGGNGGSATAPASTSIYGAGGNGGHGGGGGGGGGKATNVTSRYLTSSRVISTTTQYGTSGSGGSGGAGSAGTSGGAGIIIVYY